MELQEVKAQFDESLKPLKSNLEGLAEELKKRPNSEEVKSKIDEALTSLGKLRTEQDERIAQIEQKLSHSTTQSEAHEVKSIGQVVAESPHYTAFKDMTLKHSEKIEVGSFHKTAIVNIGGPLQPLVVPQRVPGILEPLRQRLTVRDILNVVPTKSNLIEFVKESSHTNSAAPQGKGSSPQVYENVQKSESSLGFQLAYEPVQTVAHWIPASRQVLDDSDALAAYINGRMTYFLKLEEEKQLLNGTGSGGDLNGLITQATPYDISLDKVGDTQIDTLRHAMLQCELANGNVTAFIFNPTDWHNIELIKTTGTASSGQYIFSNPHAIGVPTIWGRPVVVSLSMSSGDFLTGDFTLAADLWDRMQSSVEISREHSDFFTKNMVAILCEERLALVVYRPEVLFSGTFPSTSP